MTNRGSDNVALDLGKLLGFKSVVATAGNDAALASALGSACNRVGGETPPSVLAQVLAATYTKVSETAGKTN
jgi:hypothetical protein